MLLFFMAKEKQLTLFSSCIIYIYIPYKHQWDTLNNAHQSQQTLLQWHFGSWSHWTRGIHIDPQVYPFDKFEERREQATRDIVLGVVNNNNCRKI